MRSKYKTRAEKAAEAAAAKPPIPEIGATDLANEEMADLAEYAAVVDSAEAIAAHALATLHAARPAVPGALVAGFIRALVRFTLAEIPPEPPEVHTPASIAFMMVGAIERAAAEKLDAEAKATAENVN